LKQKTAYDFVCGRIYMNKQKGFSLIELLIVVAIILIIAAIAVPSLLKARVSANNSAAAATTRTLSTAEATYSTLSDLRLCSGSSNAWQRDCRHNSLCRHFHQRLHYRQYSGLHKRYRLVQQRCLLVQRHTDHE